MSEVSKETLKKEIAGNYAILYSLFAQPFCFFVFVCKHRALTFLRGFSRSRHLSWATNHGRLGYRIEPCPAFVFRDFRSYAIFAKYRRFAHRSVCDTNGVAGLYDLAVYLPWPSRIAT